MLAPTCAPLGRQLARASAAGLLGFVAIAGRAQTAAETATAPRPPALLTPHFVYDGTLLSVLAGGVRNGTVYVGNLHLRLSVDGEAIALPGTSAYLDLLNIHGDRPSRYVGDAQGTTNIEGPTGTVVEELWIQHNFAASRLSLLTGLYDLSSEFDRLQSAGLFLNSAFGTGTDFSQSGAGGPSIFPRTALALRFDGKPDPDIVVRGALLNGVPFVRPDGSHALFRSGDGVLGVVEVAFLSRPGSRSDAGTRTTDRIGRFSALPQYADKLALGAWRYSGSYADLSDVNSSGAPLMHRGSSGLYALLDRTIVDGGKPGQPRVSAFLQGGIADSLTNRFDSRLGAGIVGSGLPWLHDSDQAGGAVTQVRNGSHYLRSLPPTQATQRTETTFEATYLTQALKALALQPDLQYIIRPNADPSRARAWVVQMRFEISY